MTLSLADAFIIVVEDDPNAQMITLDLLRIGGASRCYLRKTVSSAISFAEKLPNVDLFLADINMPGESGFDLLKMVREHSKLKDAKVIAVTAGTLDEDIRRLREEGFDGLISKPLKAGEFSQQVQRALNGEIVWDRR